MSHILRLHEPYTHVASIYDSSPPLLRRAKYPFARLPHQESFQSIPFYPPKLSADSKKYPIFALHWFASFPHKRKLRLKGNRVQIPDSPAAVSFHDGCINLLCKPLFLTEEWEGDISGNESEDLQGKVEKPSVRGKRLVYVLGYYQMTIVGCL